MNILEEAAQITTGARHDTYGDAGEEFTRVAQVWTTYLSGRQEVTPHDFVNMMILLKVMRARHGYHRDSYVDICGYSVLAERHYEAPAPTEEVVFEDIGQQFDATLLFGEKPRVWDSILEVPVGVTVRDKDGDFWRKRTSLTAQMRPQHSPVFHQESVFLPGRDLNVFAPFIEMIDDDYLEGNE